MGRWHPGSPAELQRQFQQAQPFKHFVLDDFLDTAFCGDLLAEFPPFDRAQAINELGRAGGKAVVPDLASIGRAFREFDRMIQSREFLDWVSAATGIPDLLYDPDYIGGGTHENLSG